MLKVIQNNWFVLHKIIRTCPSQIAITICLAVINCIGTVTGVYVTKYIMDSLASKNDALAVLLFVTIICLFNIIINLFATILSMYITPQNTQRLHCQLQSELFEKARDLELEYYDDPEFYNKFSFVMNQADSRALAVLNTCSSVFSTIISSIGLIAVLSTLTPALILLVLICVVVSIMIQSKIQHINYMRTVEEIIPQRKMAYVKRIYYMQAFAQDVRLFHGLHKILSTLFRKSKDECIALIQKYAPKQCKLQICNDILAAILRGLSIAYLLLGVFRNSYSIGTFSAASAGCTQLYSQLNSLFNGFVQFYSHSLYIEDYRQFIELDSPAWLTKGNDPFPNEFNIKFNNVDYSYSGQAVPAISNVSFKINYQEKVAVVGCNGSGKSTIIKLLSRLYHPSGGEILLNGIPLDEYSIEDYKANIGVVSQNYQVFATSIAENILMRPLSGDVADVELITEALVFVNLYDKVCSFPNGIYTHVSKEFSDSGIMLSGGEIQRLVVARVYAKKCKLLLLDEATSAMDNAFGTSLVRELFKLPQTMILVTHDMEKAKLADRILVFDKGTLYEECKLNELTKPEDVYNNL